MNIRVFTPVILSLVSGKFRCYFDENGSALSVNILCLNRPVRFRLMGIDCYSGPRYSSDLFLSNFRFLPKKKKNNSEKVAEGGSDIMTGSWQLKMKMAEAGCYEEWRDAATSLDMLLGYERWKSNPKSSLYDYELIQRNFYKIKYLRERERYGDLAHYIRQSLHKNRGNIGNKSLYRYCNVGTKHLIDEYVGEIVECLNILSDPALGIMETGELVRFFEQTQQSYGRTALLLSGGANLGMFHIGVARALWKAGLLPRVFSGSSTGSLITGMLGTLTDNELEILFHPKSLRFDAWKILPFQQIFTNRSLFCPARLEEILQSNMGDLTFAEAYERTGRIINISVTSPDSTNEHRLLNYLTSPHILVWSGCMASCAMLGMFPPQELLQKNSKGQIVPFMPGTKWLDGSLRNDLPMLRLTELYNVNNFIVSQTNPYIVPFLQDRGVKGRVNKFFGTLVYGEMNLRLKQLGYILNAVGNLNTMVSLVDSLSAILRQQYRGSITIHPELKISSYLRIFGNLTMEEVESFIKDGEKAVWQDMNYIYNQTKVGQTLERCRRRVGKPGQWIDQTKAS